MSWGTGTFGDALLAPTQIYVKRLLSLIDRVDVKVRCVSSPQHRCSLLPDHHPFHGLAIQVYSVHKHQQCSLWPVLAALRHRPTFG